MPEPEVGGPLGGAAGRLGTDTGPPSGLRYLSLVVTRQCNLSCGYCYLPRAKEAWDPGPRGSMPWPVARAAVDLLLAAPPTQQMLVLTGGEPLLAFPLARRVVLYARKATPAGKRLRIRLYTNGTRLTLEVVSFLAAHDVDVQLSFDGVEQTQSRRGCETFALLDRLLIETRRTAPDFFRRHLSIALTVGPETVPFLADSIRYFLSRRVREIRVGAAFAIDGRGRASPGPAAEQLLLDQFDNQFAGIVEACVRHHEATGEVPLGLLRLANGGDARGQDRGHDLLCYAAQGESLAVDPSGACSVCPLFLTGDFRGPPARRRAGLLIGPLRDGEFSARFAAVPGAAAEGGLFRRAGKYSSFGSCSECGCASSCQACPASILLAPQHDDAERIPDFQCALFRTAARHRERFLERCGPGTDGVMAEVLRSVRLV